jgi:NIMA (never in mitosis gene a)-related kinase
MDPKQREKCLKEVSLLQSLKHPNIINYLDSFIEENELLIAIEWAEKGDLKRVIKRAQAEELPIEELKVWEYMHQIASALKHMQEKRIMHRDLKPANIFITADGTLKLGDLGLGRFLSSQTIEAFSRVGTPLYMSPEVLKGSGYDWKSDVWSLGCVVYELACLHSPFRKDDTKMSLYDLFQTISKGEFVPVGERYSEELRTIVNSMIQVNPEKRLDIDQVVELCNIQLKSWSNKKPKVDISLVMDDIQEKLKLLDYENLFCKIYKHPPVSRVYFSHHINPQEQLCYFYDLVYWLMSLNKQKSPGLRPFTPFVSSSHLGDAEEIAKHILADVKNFGIKAAETITPITIKPGHGEGVCVIINDLLNRELVRQDYKFQMPVVNEGGANLYRAEGLSPDVIEEVDFDMPDEMIWKDLQDEAPYEDYENLPKSSSTGASDLVFVEKDEEKREGIIESSVDPLEWMAEARRVASKLVLEIDFDNGIQEKLVLFKNTQKALNCFLNDSSCVGVLEKKTENIRKELEKISNAEKKIQVLCEESFVELRKVAEKRVSTFKRLNEKRKRVQLLCDEYEKIENNLEAFNLQLDAKNSEFKSNNKLNEIKVKLRVLKDDVLLLCKKEAIARLKLDKYRLINV